MDAKMNSMKSNMVWELVGLLVRIGCKWIYKKKTNAEGKVETYKARLERKGYTQKECIDYDETFFSVAILKSIHILLSIVATLDYEIWDQKNKTIALSQSSYIGKVPKRFSMTHAKPCVQPPASGFHLSLADYPKAAEEREHMSKVSYASAVGSLMYVLLCTRPDIFFAVEMVSQYQANPGPKYWQVVKHILRPWSHSMEKCKTN
ncbi:zf-CCHC domain-containing protein [Gossypium australe]|uniref:Zf-CCHC domain-containing protein n=1 Tax=Gossypium australe TaxID=47621 RepID=A0A5B6VVC2_9ROSI|nr:zf-CCHC domain-containing protein [Gossypium australe]